MNVLVINYGSSTLKFQVSDMDGENIATGQQRDLARGLLEGIGKLGTLGIASRAASASSRR